MSLSPLPRLCSLFRKEMLETFRDWKMLSMTLTFAPFFVLLMYAYLGHTTPTYQIAVVNQDVGATAAGRGAAGVGPGVGGIPRGGPLPGGRYDPSGS